MIVTCKENSYPEPNGVGQRQHGAHTGKIMVLFSLRYLVVEDHAFQRDMLKRSLLALGAHSVHSAENGRQALAVLRDPDRPVDIVISDLMMPEVDGIELIPLLQQAAQRVALILTSADPLSLRAAQEIAKGHGIALLGAVAKPLTAENLAPLLQLYEAQRAAENRAAPR